MMDTLLKMSVTGTIVICVVLALRLCLRRAPKIFSYALWLVVLFRLLCPVSIASPVSAFRLIPSAQMNAVDQLPAGRSVVSCACLCGADAALVQSVCVGGVFSERQGYGDVL